MKKLAALFALLLLSVPLFASYEESIRIIVVDQLGRPVQGASAWAKYWVRYETQANTSKLVTGPDGIARVVFHNYDPDTGARTKYDYTIYAQFGGEVATASLSHNTTIVYREDPYPMHVTAYSLWVKLLDQNRQPHSNTSVFFGPVGYTTDPSGNALLQVGGGTINLTLRKGGFESTRTLSITNDTTEQLIWPIYAPKVKVVDDLGSPLNATVTIGDAALQTNASGIAEFPRTPMPSAEIRVVYGQRQKSIAADFSTQESLTIPIDTHKPVFKSVPQVELVDGLGRITIEVADEGQYASGFDENSHFVVRYRVKGRERDASMYTVKRGTYQADIPVQPPNTYVSFSITITDKDGNSNRALGEYIVPAVSIPNPNGYNQSGGGSGSGGGAGGETIFGFEPMVAYAGVGAALIALVAGYFLILKKKDEY